jgi:DNA-binding NtrC family response regulator
MTMKKQQMQILNSEKMKTFFYHTVIIKNINSNSRQLPTLERLKKEYIEYLLKITDNNKTETADILNISIPGLYKKIQRYGLCH